MKKKYSVIFLLNFLFVFNSWSFDLGNPPDSIVIDTLFTFSNYDVNQIYQKDMTLDKINEFDKAYYKDYFINENTTTIANRFDYGAKYYGGIQIHKFPSGIKNNVDFKESPIANTVYHTGLNQIYNDSQFTANLKIRLGNINPAKHPFLKIKYRPIGNRDFAGNYEDKNCHCWAGINNLNIQAYWGYLMVSNNSISNIPKVTNNDSLGNFYRISPLSDKGQFPVYIDKSRSDYIFSQRVETVIDNQSHTVIKYIYDTIIPLWNNVNLNNFEIIIRGSAIQLLDDVLIYSIDTFKTTEVNKISKEIESVKVYPNPTNGVINIDFNQSTTLDYQIALMDAYGKILINNKNLKSIDITSYSNGFYYLQIESEGRKFTKKIVKVH